MRVQRLTNLQNYHSVTGDRKGLHVLTNVSVQDGDAETVRVNLDIPNSSCRRIGSQSKTFPRQKPPFDILCPSLLLSAEQLGQWQGNFASVYDAVGDKLLGNIRNDDSANDAILRKLQACSFEITHIDDLLDTLPVGTALYSSYLAKNARIDLVHGIEPTPVGRRLLDEFETAVAVYSRVPELRHYVVQDDPQTDVSPRGQRLRQWLSQGHNLALGDGCTLAYVAHELKPLHLSGRDFCWKQNGGDLRLISVDLLCCYKDQPVWCEVKMAGDTLTSSAVLQILFYGSMLSSGHQRRRLKRFFSDQFGSTRPWLGILVENRTDKDFPTDFEQAVAFASHPGTKEVLQPHFDGIIFSVLDPENGGWAAKPTIVRW
jgi:hypothetical protein